MLITVLFVREIVGSLCWLVLFEVFFRHSRSWLGLLQFIRSFISLWFFFQDVSALTLRIVRGTPMAHVAYSPISPHGM